MTVGLTRRVVQLVVSCVLLGAGVALLLNAHLGSDGYSMLINGLSKFSGIEFAVVNICVGVLFVSLAWLRGRTPGLGTVIQPAVVGFTVSALLPVVPEPDAWAGQVVEFVAAFVLLCIGVAGYLGTDLGAGPAEVAALAFDPPVPFKWSYSVFQFFGGLVGWLCGATFGVGTVIVVLLIGPVVARLIPLFTARVRTESSQTGPDQGRSARPRPRRAR
jgi:uncharacterized membrane protein YczE